MKINWRHLSYAMIISVIVNGVAGIILLMDYVVKVNSLFEILLSEPDYIVGVEPKPLTMTIAVSGGNSVTTFLVWILIFALSFVVLTLISYYIIGYLCKRTG